MDDSNFFFISFVIVAVLFITSCNNYSFIMSGSNISSNSTAVCNCTSNSTIYINTTNNITYNTTTYITYSDGWEQGSGTIYNTTASVGIGTSSPNQRLEVVGTVNATDMYIGEYGVCTEGNDRCYSGDTTHVVWKDEFQYYATARTEGIGICAALSSGTAAQVANEYIGVIRFSDSTTANGGFQCRSTSNMYFKGGERFTLRFKVINRATNVHQFGFSDSTTAADPTDGCWLSGANLQFTGKCKNNAGPTTTGTSYTVTTNTWYTGTIYAESSSYINFSIYDSTGTNLLWSDKVIANIPTTSARASAERIASWETSTDAAAIMSYFDYVQLDVVGWQ